MKHIKLWPCCVSQWKELEMNSPMGEGQQMLETTAHRAGIPRSIHLGSSWTWRHSPPSSSLVWIFLASGIPHTYERKLKERMKKLKSNMGWFPIQRLQCSNTHLLIISRISFNLEICFSSCSQMALFFSCSYVRFTSMSFSYFILIEQNEIRDCALARIGEKHCNAFKTSCAQYMILQRMLLKYFLSFAAMEPHTLPSWFFAQNQGTPPLGIM